MSREHPILFKGELVRAILAGKKTQTRRLVTLGTSQIAGATNGVREAWKRLDWAGAKPKVMQPTGGPPVPLWSVPDLQPEAGTEDAMWHVLPRVRAGDRLWVRETWCVAASLNDLRPVDIFPGPIVRYRASHHPHASAKWRPGIHMPRWACRLTLEVTSVRAERIQDITRQGALAEGVGSSYARDAFRGLWDLINGKRPGAAWSDNPALWVLEWRPVA